MAHSLSREVRTPARSGSLLIGMLAARIVVIGQNDHRVASYILFTAGRQPVARSAKCESGRAHPRKRVHILFTFRPVNRLIGLERI